MDYHERKEPQPVVSQSVVDGVDESMQLAGFVKDEQGVYVKASEPWPRTKETKHARGHPGPAVKR